MKIKHECPYCNNELWVEKKDIKPLSKTEIKSLDLEHKMYDSYKKEFTKNLFGKKKPKYSNELIELMKRQVFGKVKCVCGAISYIIKDKKRDYKRYIGF